MKAEFSGLRIVRTIRRGWCAHFAAVLLHAQTPAPVDSVPVLDSARLLGNLAALSADSMEGRRVGTPGGARARGLLLREFARVGLKPVRAQFTDNFSALAPGPVRPTAILRPDDPRSDRDPRPPSRDRQFDPLVLGVNLLGVVRGTVHPDRYIVVSAHYDHLGIRDGDIYHGADDNASGTAAILTIAEWAISHPPENSLLFAWFDGEESGLLGSKAFMAHPPVPREKIIADVNVDMVSRNVRGELFAAGASRYPVMKPFLDSVAALGLVTLRLGHDVSSLEDDWTNRSDEGPFNDRKIPFIHFGVEEHIDYHQPSDTFAHIYPAFYYRSVRTIAEFVRRLDRSLDPVAEVRRHQ